MKHSSFFLLLFSFLSTAFGEVNLDHLEGVYDVRSTDVPLRSVVTIKKIDPHSGEVFFKTSKSLFGKMNCRGFAKINTETNELETESKCKSGLEFHHAMALENIDNFDTFSTRVRNTLYGDEIITVHFKRQ
ncbi:MAG: hypothetical protein OXB88_00080 [Bacteriovoracales bacterium]|nr:hypothetical protein [Bacteriovoracales bacterium]